MQVYFKLEPVSHYFYPFIFLCSAILSLILCFYVLKCEFNFYFSIVLANLVVLKVHLEGNFIIFMSFYLIYDFHEHSINILERENFTLIWIFFSNSITESMWSVKYIIFAMSHIFFPSFLILLFKSPNPCL